jgi:glycosyltransferase involved in cell wall biosynthesis
VKIGIYQSYWGPVGGGQRYVGVVAAILARRHEVEIVHHAADFDRARVEEALEIDLSAVRFRLVPRLQRPAWPARTPWGRLRLERDWRREISQPYDVFIDSSDSPPYFCHARHGVLLIHFPLMTYEEFHGHTSDAWRRRPAVMRRLASLFHRWEWKRRLAGYELCLVNSQYTRKWIKRLWGIDAQVLYPPLRRDLRPADKEPLILSIGAFHRAQHKKHGDLIEAFRELAPRLPSGWRYAMVGAVGPTAEDRAYLQGLQDAARGLPIEIRANAAGGELRSLLGRASILWHSMGYGVDPDRDPSRFEHFGMVATEAMAAGCVPVVFNGGGLPEIVTSGQNGFLWSTLDELASVTERLAADRALLERMSQAALARSQDFSDEVFEKRLWHVLGPALDER